MLLALVEYAERQLPDAEPGFKTREVRWSIELSADGRFLGIVPLGDGKRGQDQPRCPDMHGMNAGGKSHFLVETAQTVALYFKPNEDEKKIANAETKHNFFVDLLHKASTELPELEPLTRVLADESQLALIRDALDEHKAKPTDWVGWRVNGHDPRENPAVQAWWREWRRNDLNKQVDKNDTVSDTPHGDMLCLLTGKSVKPLPTHPKITGLAGVGGLGTGDVMVGFDKAAFGSYGLDQSANAAMDPEAVQKYVDGLNDLIRNHSRKLGNSLVAHWFKEQVPVEDDPLAFLYEYEGVEQSEAAALGAARRLLDSIRSGKRAELGNNRYYALTLSGAAGRVMVRDWMEGSFEELVRNVAAWFDDLSIAARDGKGLAPDPKFMAVCGALVRDLKDLPAPTVATLWKTAVQKLPIPQPLMAQALARFRAEVVDKDQLPFNHARMGLIKAYFVRLKPGGDPTMTAYLNPDHPSAAYHCGRLLAVLANLQRAALGDVGAGVVQRYYAAFSQTPGLILGRLISNARNHLGKLDEGRANWYEERIAEVMSRLKDNAPRILDLEGQGLFALGYYQQLAALRAGNKNNATESTTQQGEMK
jgi:CRISPR-associated protein Csd1